MTPPARLAAAIDILDRVLAGVAAEKALTNWGRANRYAGSGDRNAVRDLVFDALRCRRSFAHLGGGLTGRGLILGALRSGGQDPVAMFTGQGYGPAALTDADAAPPEAPQGLVALDCPDWLAPALQASLGQDFAPVMAALRNRAPTFLRANLPRADLNKVQHMLAAEGIAARPHPLAKTALEVTENARKIQNSKVYMDGLAELQDAASQAVVAALPLVKGQRVLDYCAGGGGKTLAMAAQARIRSFAHDADPARMRDLAPRAARAGVSVTQLSGAQVAEAAPFDLVLADVPCSGSGSWRRAPEGKWALTPDRLAELCAIQADILNNVAGLVGPGGYLCYATCSLLEAENGAQIADFLARSDGWHLQLQHRFTPLEGGDGFFVAIMGRVD